jgi:excisionase family DNA binding protein
LTINDVARLAGVSGDTVRLWDRTKKLPAVRTAGGIRLFFEDEVQKFLAARASDERLSGDGTYVTPDGIVLDPHDLPPEALTLLAAFLERADSGTRPPVSGTGNSGEECGCSWPKPSARLRTIRST